ncbi:hypothetical protein ACFO6R_16050 [Eubacterium multiforme]|uniref:Uncharacterized protein n=1 Tax=Eubacterium multiforme TaxID=83339 RepID=A0ABT9UTK0_9FIRM|nr:hypothetical protein [Eubacterium multiforme]MDQ0149625.1 hypothetical protein [Eubacterium multiforme]
MIYGLISALFIAVIFETIVIIVLLDKYIKSLKYIKLLEKLSSYEMSKNKKD